MKIVHVVRQFWPSSGGLEEFVRRLALEQVAKGDDVRIVTLDELFTRRGVKLPEREMREGIDIQRIPFRGSSRYPLAPSVLRYIRDADIIHVHAIDFFFDFLALTLGLRGRTLVATTHGGFFHTSKNSLLKRVWFNTATRLSSRFYAAIVACSESDYQMFAEISPANLRLVENGVDIGKFANLASAEPTKSMITIGRLSDNKRIDRLLDMMSVLAAEDSEWRLRIVGTESDWSGERLRQEVSARGLDAQVECCLGLDDAGVADVIRQSSIFVSASEHEGFGIALVEALSAGLLPVVHGNAAYRSFALKHGVVRIVDFSDPYLSAVAVRDALAELAVSPALRNEGINVAAKFAWPHVGEKYKSVYREVLRRSAGAPVDEAV